MAFKRILTVDEVTLARGQVPVAVCQDEDPTAEDPGVRLRATTIEFFVDNDDLRPGDKLEMTLRKLAP